MSHLENKILSQARLLIPFAEGRCRHVSLILRRSTIMSCGVNSYTKTSTISAKYGHRGSYIHSELSAIVHFPKSQDITRCTMYNVRIKSSGEVSLSKPCRSCQNLLNAFGVKKVMYTTDFGRFVEWEGD